MTQQKTGVWKEWTGGLYPPVPQGAEFLYKMRGSPNISRHSATSFELDWKHNYSLAASAEIIAYMIVPTYVPTAKPERWRIVKRVQPRACASGGFDYLTHYAIFAMLTINGKEFENDATSTKLGNLVATTDGEYALLTRFAKLLNEVAP